MGGLLEVRIGVVLVAYLRENSAVFCVGSGLVLRSVL